MKMVKIIETNLLVDGENNIRDHQARWVLINDWEEYCKKYQNYSGRCVHYGIASSMPGVDIPADAKITMLQFDERHLSCDIHHRDHFVTKRFAYNIDVDAAQELDEEREKNKHGRVSK